jgi:hypothetical protein
MSRDARSKRVSEKSLQVENLAYNRVDFFHRIFSLGGFFLCVLECFLNRLVELIGCICLRLGSVAKG